MILWLPFFAAASHVFEEFAWPGGFPAWYHRYMPARAGHTSTRFFVIINAIFLGLCAAIPFLDSKNAAALWLYMTAVMASNAVFHIRGAIVSRRYSPGVATSVILYLPMAFWGYWYFVSTGAASMGTAVVAAITGGSYQLVSGALHARAAGAPSSKKMRKSVEGAA